METWQSEITEPFLRVSFPTFTHSNRGSCEAVRGQGLFSSWDRTVMANQTPYQPPRALAPLEGSPALHKPKEAGASWCGTGVSF